MTFADSANSSIGSIYLSTLAPRYFRSIYISIGCTALGLFITIATALVLKMQNKRKERLVMEGALDQPELGDKNPHYTYWL